MCELTRGRRNNPKRRVNDTSVSRNLIVYASRAIVVRPVRLIAYVLNYILGYTCIWSYSRTEEEKVLQIILALLEQYSNAKEE